MLPNGQITWSREKHKMSVFALKETAKQLANSIKMDNITDIILDWDGTCIERGEELWMEGCVEAINSLGGLVTPNEITKDLLSCTSQDDLYNKLARHTRVDNLSILEIRQKIDDSIVQRSLKCKLFQGFLELLDFTNKKGIKLHIYTMRSENVIRDEIARRNLSNSFHSINGSTTELQKIHLGAIAKKIPEAKSETTLIIGDTVSDARMAKNHNSHCIKIGTDDTRHSYSKMTSVRNFEMTFYVISEIYNRSQNKAIEH